MVRRPSTQLAGARARCRWRAGPYAGPQGTALRQGPRRYHGRVDNGLGERREPGHGRVVGVWQVGGLAIRVNDLRARRSFGRQRAH